MSFRLLSRTSCLPASPLRNIPNVGLLSSHTSRNRAQSRASFSTEEPPVEYQVLKLDTGTRVGRITLNSPQTYNALTVAMGHEFTNVVRHVVASQHDHKENTLSAVVVCGKGPAFSAGGNYDWLQQLGHNHVHVNVDAMLQFYKSFLCIRNVPVPTIAVLSGPAVGAGAGLALACDFRTANASQRKLLGLNFTRLGIHSGMGASHFLMQQGLGASVMNDILLTGRMLSTDDCRELKLLYEQDGTATDAMQAALELSREFGKRHPVAVRTLLRTLRSQQDVGLDLALEREAYAQSVCYAREDWGEGVQAVAGKRDPSFDPYYIK